MRWCQHTLGLALAYALSGGLVYLIRQPMDQAVVFWPAAGVAFLAVLFGGARLAPGVWLGSFALNCWVAWSGEGAFSSIACLVRVMVALGAAAQALLGAAAVRRWVGAANPLTAPRDIFLFLLIAGPAHTLVAASWSTAWLLAPGDITPSQIPGIWLHWWVGDALGSLAITPLALSLLGHPRAVWRPRLLTVALPLLVLISSVLTFHLLARDWERDRIHRELTALAEQLPDWTRGWVRSYRVAVDAWLNRLQQIGPLAPVEVLDRDVKPLLEYHNRVVALVFIASVPPEHRAAFLQAQEQAGRKGFRIQDADIPDRPAGTTPPLSVIAAVWPAAAGKEILGREVGRLPELREAMRQAVDGDRPRVVLAPFAFPGLSDDGLLMLRPLYRPGTPTGSPGERRHALFGHVGGVIPLAELSRRLSELLGSRQLALTFSATPPPMPPDGSLDWHPDRVEFQVQFEVDGLELVARVTGGRTYLALHSLRYLRVVLVFGLVTTFLLAGVLLTVTGQTIEVEQTVRRRTDELREEVKDRQAAEEALRQARDELEVRVQDRTSELRQVLAFQQSVIRTAAEGICVWTTVDSPPFVHFSVWNDQMTRITGYSLEEINRPGRVQALVDDPARRQQALEWLGRLRQREELRGEEWAITRCDGSRRLVALFTSALEQEDGPPAVITMIHDVTERHQAETERERHYNLLQAVLGGAVDLVYVKDLDGRYLLANPATCRAYGLSAEEVLGHTDHDLFPTSTAEQVIAFDRRVLAAGRTLTEEETIEMPSGPCTYLTTKGVYRDETGGALGVFGISRDMTERKQAERAMRESESRLRALVNSATDSIITFTATGLIDSANPAAERMFGYEEMELIGRPLALLLPGFPSRGQHLSASADRPLELHTLLGAGREVQVRRKNGSSFPVDLAVSEITPLGLYTAIIRDITIRKAMEHEVLEIATREQHRLGQELHDGVGQELTGLGLLADALTQRLRERGFSETMLAVKVTDGLLRVHQQVRALSHGLVPVEVDPEGLRAALEQLADRTTEQSGVECRFGGEGSFEIPDTLTATHLFRIVREAVSNALRHARPRCIRIHWQARVESLTLSVTDDGCGMVGPPGSGEGLGIRLMQYRAGVIGGTLSIGPAEGGGTRVVCQIPTQR